MTIWTHEICYCKYESGFTVQSVHSERSAAIRAMLAAKREAIEEQLEFRRLYGKRRGDLYELQPHFDAQLVRGMAVDGGEIGEVLRVNVGRGRDW
jgi:hypothetical protein